MENLLVEKEVFLEVLEKKAKIQIFKEAQVAIEKGWESLYFSDNLNTFATMEVGDYIAVLDTHGEVRIISDNEEEVYDGSNTDDIVKILDEGRIDDYTIDNNNWFTIVFGKITKREPNGCVQFDSIDDLVFEATPNSLEELEEQLIEYATSLYEMFAK